jgi:hypothetical protein
MSKRHPFLSLGVAAIATAVALLLSAAALAASAPSVNGVSASQTTLSSTVLSAYVDPRGASTTYYFQYGTSTAYGSQTPTEAAGAGWSEVKVSAAISGLASGTAYHFRLVAASASGTTIGPDHVFTTTSIPLSFQVSVLPNQIFAGGSFAVEGTLSGSGSAGREVELQMNRFPFYGMARLGAPTVTDASGHFAFAGISLLENARFRVSTVATPHATSAVIAEQVAVRVLLHARRLRSARGKLYRLYGTVAPAQPGGHVALQLIRYGHAPLGQGGARVRAGGQTYSRFSTILRIRRPGLYRAFVAVSTGRNVAGYSAPVRIR